MKRRFSCFLVKAGWHSVPLAGFRDWLIRTHLAGCAGCQEQAASREDVLNLLGDGEGLWPQELVVRAEAMAEKLEKEKEEKKAPARGYSPGLRRLYTGLAALVIIVLMAGFAWYLLRSPEKETAVRSDETNKTEMVSKVSLVYIRAMGQPASTYIFQTGDPEMIIIWVEAMNQF